LWIKYLEVQVAIISCYHSICSCGL